MKIYLTTLTIFIIAAFSSCATQKGSNSSSKNTQYSEQELINLSKQKWQWMADKNTAELEKLFHANSMFVHMGGSWGKQRELDVIKSGDIHYKHAEIQEYSVKFIDNAAFVYNKIRLTAVVGGNEVVNPFMVTEGYLRQNNEWKLASMAFTRLMGN